MGFELRPQPSKVVLSLSYARIAETSDNRRGVLCTIGIGDKPCLAAISGVGNRLKTPSYH